MSTKKRGHFLTVDGVKMPICFTPSAAMARAMRDAMAPTKRKYDRDEDDRTAIWYASWLARRDGVTVPAAHSKETGTVRAIVERDYCKTAGPAYLSWRPRFVQWESGGMRSQMLYSPRGKFKGYGPSLWECDAVLLRIEIPHWDHTATARDCAQQELAA